MAYDQAFFDLIRPGCQASAAVIAPIVHGLLNPQSVIDVGCGEGHWALAFEALGCSVLGVDGPKTRPMVDAFVGHDLRKPLDVDRLGQFDLAVSLEVAEHLPERRAPWFVSELCGLAPVVLFSAAVPKQGGVQHLNEQWPSYWADMFTALGYRVSGGLRWLIWDDDRVENWYRQNLLLCVLPSIAAGLPELFEGPHNRPLSIVHPVLWEAYRDR